MTIAGLLWGAIALVLFFYPNIKYLLALTMVGMTLQCVNVVQISGQGIGPQIITSALFVARVILMELPQIRVPVRRNACLMGSMILVFMSATISLISNGLLGAKMLVLLQLLIYILCYICMVKISSSIDEDFIFRLIKGITVFLLIVGIIQLLITTNIIPRLGIVSQLLFNEKRGAVYYYHNNYMRITSTYMEPSYYAGFIVGAFYYILERAGFDRNKLLLFVIVFEIVFTFSSTAYATVCLIGIVYVLTSDMPIKRKTEFIAVGLLLIVIMYFGFYNVLDKVIFSKGTSGSANKRNNMNARAFADFFDKPIYGHGYKNYRASSIIYCILAELGLLGIISYLCMFCGVVVLFFNKKWNERKGKKAILFAVLAGFIAQLIACPDLDLCTFWLWMYFLGLYCKPKYEAKKIESPQLREV